MHSGELMILRYRQSVLAELSKHGVVAGDDTPPEIAREKVNDLYLIEIRSLRDQMKAGLIPLADYSTRVKELKDRYPLLGLPLQFWMEDPSGS
jgi:hypothetical protein